MGRPPTTSAKQLSRTSVAIAALAVNLACGGSTDQTSDVPFDDRPKTCDPLGKPKWASVLHIGAAEADYIHDIALVDGGYLLAGSVTTSPVRFGSTTFDLPDRSVSYLLRVDDAGDVEWITFPKSTGFRGIAVAPDDSIYVTGSFRDSAEIDGQPLVGIGQEDAFVARLDASGSIETLRVFGAAEHNEEASSVVVLDDGTVCIGGQFASTSMDVGSITLVNSSPNYPDAFLICMDEDLDVLSASATTGAKSERIEIRHGGGGVIGGFGTFLGDSMTFDGTELPNRGSTDLFWLVTDRAGQLDWARAAGGNSLDNRGDMRFDADQNAYITGTYGSNSFTFDGVQLQLTNPTAFANNLFLAKYDPSGVRQWVIDGDQPSSEAIGNGVAIAPAGEVLVTGSFARETMALGGFISPATATKTCTWSVLTWMVRPSGASPPAARRSTRDKRFECATTGRFFSRAGSAAKRLGSERRNSRTSERLARTCSSRN